MSHEPVKNFFASASVLSRSGFILTSVWPFFPFCLLKRVSTSSIKSTTQNEVFTSFDCDVASQLKDLLFSSRGIFRNAKEPSSFFPYSISSKIKNTVTNLGAGRVLGYSGIKQRREPMLAAEYEGVLPE